MNPPSIRVAEVVLHRVGNERFTSLSEQKEADMEMGLDLRHLTTTWAKRGPPPSSSRRSITPTWRHSSSFILIFS